MSHEPTWPQDATMPAGISHPLTRREWLVSAAALAAVAGSPPLTARSALAQTPKRGGTLTLRLWDPPHWDPYLIIAFKTQIPYTFTHSRLLRHKAGPAIQPGTFPLEGDLAESWSQTDETTYVFKLRRGVRFHPKPPVNGRELTADDVVYSVERFRTVTGNPQAYMLAAVDKVEALDRYTVRFTVKEPFAWFPDMIANPMTLAIIARECVEKFGDLKKAEAVVGTGPWMLDSYRPNVGYTLVRNPGYFLPGLPHIDRIEVVVDEDNASRMAAFLTGKYDLGWEFPGAINRTDWIQIKDQVKRRRPTLQTAEFPSNVGSKIIMRTDKAPFADARVRRAVSHAVNRQAIIDSVNEGAGVFNAAVPSALKDWALPVDQLGEGSRYYKYDPAEARRLLAEAGYPRGFSTVMDFHNFGSTLLVDAMQLVVKDLKSVGIEVKLNQKEYGAFISSTAVGNYEGIYYGPATPFLDPDNYLYTVYYPGHPRNIGKINDPVLTDLLIRQRRLQDPAKRRQVIHDIQRHVAGQQHLVEVFSVVLNFAWDGALRNYGPNLGYDYGGRLLSAWLER
jgi:peptide/nickel transport system substrate-binding protein